MSAEDVRFVNKVIEKINSDYDAIIVPVKIESYSVKANCFYNVEEKVKRDGGSIVYGWSVMFGVYICEAERHAVWRSTSGKLLDITQNTSGMTDTCFVPQELEYRSVD